MSNLSALEYVQNRSALSTGLFNQRLSVISANFAALDFTSGGTTSVLSGLSVGNDLWVKGQILSGQDASITTSTLLSLGTNSNVADYIRFSDTSASRSNYIVGSHVGGTADGLNIWDDSAGTMIVSFSKQSIRFYQNVVGPVFDVGGALADTYNAATFIGSGSTLSGIQAAINQASIDHVHRVYLPASMYPYDASKISFIYPIRMVREGGDWTRFDVKAYGASGDGVTDDVASFKATAAASGLSGGIVFMPAATYMVSTPVYWPQGIMVLGDGRAVTVIKRISSSVTNGSTNNSGMVFTTGPSDGTNYLVGSHGSYIAFQDFTIDGNAAGISSITSIVNVNLACQGLHLHYMDYAQTNRVEIRNCLESGLYAWGCRRSEHFGTVSRRNGLVGVANDRNGFQITGPQDSLTTQGAQDEHVFMGCSAVSNQDEGLSGGNNGKIVVVGGIFTANGDHGIEGDTGTATSFVTSVPAGWVVSGAYVFENGGTGIAIGNANVQRIAISGCVVENNGGHGIACTTQSGGIVSITGNTLLSNGTTSTSFHGITVNSGFSDVVIVGNVLDGVGISAGGGIVLTSQQSQRLVNITGNSIANYGTNGISVAGQATGTIASNSVCSLLGAFSDGIVAFASTASLDNLLLVGNQVMNTREYGFRLRSTGTWNLSNVRLWNNVATDNQTTKTQTYGLSIDTGNTGSILSLRVDGNDFSGNLTGTIQNLLPSMTATGMLDSTSSVSFGATMDATRGIISTGTLALKTGTAINPSIAFSSESSLGFFRSASSVIQQSYGTLAVSNYSSMNAGGGSVEFTAVSGNVFSHNVANGTYFFDLGTVQFRNGNHNGTVQGAIYVGDGSLTTLGYGFTSDKSLGFYRSGASTIAMSFGTFNLAKGAVRLSMRTLAASAVTVSAAKTNVAVDEVVFTVGGASGASLCIMSGGTCYIFNSALSAAQA